MIFRFIGIEGHVADVKMEAFGQAVELSEADGAAAISGNFPILPDAEFQACGFTPEELTEYAYPGPRSECSMVFAEKWKAARVALHEVRERLNNGGHLARTEVLTGTITQLGGE